jgi:hypothetical protein
LPLPDPDAIVNQGAWLTVAQGQVAVAVTFTENEPPDAPTDVPAGTL